MVRSAASRRAGIAAVGLVPATFTQRLQTLAPAAVARAARVIAQPSTQYKGLPPLASSSKLARNRQWRQELAAIALRAQLGRELLGDVPGKDDRALRLVGEQPTFLDHRNGRPRHALADLERARDLADVVDDRLVEAEIIDEGGGARGRADAADARASLLEIANHREEPKLRQHHVVAENFQPREHRLPARLGGEHFRDAVIDRLRAAPPGIDANRSAVSRDRSGVKDFEPVHLQEVGEAVERVVPQVLMIDGVVLQPIQQTDEVVRFGYEHAVGTDEIENAFDDRMHILDMRKAIRRRHHARAAVLALDLGGHRRGEVAHEGWDAAAVGDLADLGRLDAEDAVVLEVREQRAVIRADVDDEILRSKLEQRRGLRIELGKIIAQQLGGAAGVGIFGREDDDGIDRQAELHQ